MWQPKASVPPLWARAKDDVAITVRIAIAIIFFMLGVLSRY
jgi:hypothetical protein